MMTAAIMEKWGGPEVIQIRDDVPIPTMKPTQCMIKVYATTAGGLDPLLRTYVSPHRLTQSSRSY